MRIMRVMMAIAHIRTQVFKMTQAAFAEVAGVTQPTVSRWENGQWEPNRDDLGRIREAAIRLGIVWDDRWFFDPPIQSEQVPQPAQA